MKKQEFLDRCRRDLKDFSGVDFSDADFTYDDIQDAITKDPHLRLRGVKLNRQGIEAFLKRGFKEFSGFDFRGVNFEGFKLPDGCLSGAELDKEGIVTLYRQGYRDFSSCRVNSEDLRGLDLSGTNLSKILFYRCDLSGVGFRGADLSNAEIIDSNLSDADFRDINLTGTLFCNVTLKRNGIEFLYAQGRRCFSGFKLSGVDLTELNLPGMSFSGATLDRAGIEALYKQGYRDFSNCRVDKQDLRGFDFRGANLSRIHLDGCDLSGSDLRGANLAGAEIYDTELSGAQLSEVNLEGVSLDTSALAAFYAAGYRDFRGCDLSCVYFTWHGSHIDFEGADIRGAALNVITVMVLYKSGYRDFRGCKIQGGLSTVKFEDFDLTGSDFSGADLSRVDFKNVNLTDVNLRGAKLSNDSYRHNDNINFTRTKLDRNGIKSIYSADNYYTRSDFSGCDLSDQDLTGLNLMRANLQDINFTNAILKDVKLDVQGVEAICRGRNSNDISGIDLSGIKLKDVEIKEGIKGEPDTFIVVLSDRSIEITAREVKCIDHAIHGSRRQYGAVEKSLTDEQLWDVFLDVYARFAPKSSEALGRHKLGFFDKPMAKAAAFFTGCFPEALVDNDSLSWPQRFLRLKHYADNKPDTDTGKAWQAMGKVQAYRVSTLDGDAAWLLLPQNMELLFRADRICDGFEVAGERNPEEWKSVFEACMRRYDQRLPDDQRLSKGESCFLHKDGHHGMFTRVIGEPPAKVAVASEITAEDLAAEHTGGGAAAAASP